MVNTMNVRESNKEYLANFLSGANEDERYAEPTNKTTIAFWLNDVMEDEANTHLIIATDTYDYSDYPVRVSNRDNIDSLIEHYNGNMQKVMEVYKLDHDISEQLNSRFNWIL